MAVSIVGQSLFALFMVGGAAAILGIFDPFMIAFLIVISLQQVKELFLFFTLRGSAKARRRVRGTGRYRISAVIPAHNEEARIGECIESLLGQVDEIIVVDDGSIDKTGSVAKRFGVRVVRQKNQGKVAALNRGIRLAEGDLVLTVDADTRIKKGSVRKMRVRMGKDVGAVTGGMYIQNPLASFMAFLQMLDYHFINFSRHVEDLSGNVSIAPGMFTLYRKSVLKRVGCFDPEMIVEDYDLSVKIHELGYRIRHARRAWGFTQVPLTIRKFMNQRIRWYRGGLQVLRKHKLSRRFGRNLMIAEFLGNLTIALLFGLVIFHKLVHPPIFVFFLVRAFSIFLFVALNVMISILYIMVVLFDTNAHAGELLVSLSMAPLLFYGMLMSAAWFVAFIEELLGIGRRW